MRFHEMRFHENNQNFSLTNLEKNMSDSEDSRTLSVSDCAIIDEEIPQRKIVLFDESVFEGVAYSINRGNIQVGNYTFPIFDPSNICTISFIISLSNVINLNKVFRNISIGPDDVEGSVLSAHYCDKYKGVLNFGKNMKNSIMIKIYLPDTNIHINLSNSTLQLTGCKNYYHPELVWKYLGPIVSGAMGEEIFLDEKKYAMTNMSYKLGFKINKIALARSFAKLQDFHVVYKANVNTVPSIKLPIRDKDGNILMKKGKKEPQAHTFKISISGSIIQSSKDIGEMVEAYYRFQIAISKMYDVIKANFE